TEHIPIETMHAAEAVRPVRPSANVLANIHDRLAQKRFLEKHGFPQPAFAEVATEADLQAAAKKVGTPAVLKTRRGGYDGKGQSRAMTPGSELAAWTEIGRAPCIYEAFVPFEKEVSVILARGVNGETRVYPLAENEHRKGILHTTRVPAKAPEASRLAAEKVAVGIAEALGHVGVIAVEMFLLKDGTVLVNEIAPRTHNSSHFTFGACSTSQFEQHARAVLGLPLGDPGLLTPVVMVNILGDAWKNGEPDWNALLRHGEIRLHLYGKKDMKPGRKVGHFLILGDASDATVARADELLAALSTGSK
ncbi:MAG TPA: 5-(carboxyamino)imidazole ribonucleotide synthase, partial [Candidatus Thermoplasmatota archaeon]|nr:5-(carboxyamino)imidazole ribonucleotide synthase [Candidatus Thermoplasmatota archaeon]